MKPIRKDEQEYLRTYISDKFRDKRSALESDRELEVEAQSKKNYKKFVSTLKISSMMKQAEKLQKDYDSFVASKERVEGEKLQKLKRHIQLIEDQMRKWKNIRRWDESPSFMSYNSDRPRLHNIETYINKVLQEETRKAYDNSPKGRAIKQLDAQRESCQNALYSGSSLGSVRGYIHNVLTKAQISDSIPNQLMIESK
jgi:small-conductance mechanosensitive channel